MSRSRSEQTAGRAGPLLVTALVAAVVVLIVVTLVDFNRKIEKTASRATSAPTLVAEREPEQVLPPLELPKRAKVVFVGDSWTEGYAASPGNGFAEVLARWMGWRATIIRKGSGTGYLNPAKYATETYGTFADRIGQQKVDRGVSLVVMQGSLNDQRYEEIGSTTFNGAVEATIRQARQTYPKAEILLVGPLDTNSVVPNDDIAMIDSRLARTSRDVGAYYVSPTQERWFPNMRMVTKLIDEEAAFHPTTEGHAYLAKRLQGALKSLAKDGVTR